MVGLTAAEASAYLPAIVVALISTDTVDMLLAMVTALLLVFGLPQVANMAFVRAQSKKVID